MLLTLVCMLPSVLPRLPLGLFQSLLSILLAVYGALVLCVGIDTLRHRRLHPAFAIGGAVFVLVMQLAFCGMQTPAWHGFLTRLLG